MYLELCVVETSTPINTRNSLIGPLDTWDQREFYWLGGRDYSKKLVDLD